MLILGIETSCDETALSLIEVDTEISDKNTLNLENSKLKVLATVLYSQIEKHRPYGGVFPALAKREHSKNIIPLFKELIKKYEAQKNLEEKSITKFQDKEIKINTEKNDNQLTNIFSHEPDLNQEFKKELNNFKIPKIDFIAVTEGPGLEPALWVGINFARAISIATETPVLPINHMEGHIYSVLVNENYSNNKESNIKKISFPAISLLISGGHTEIIKINNWGDYEILGQTKDDAVGEAYDKVARLLNLPYPGGPEISKLADNCRQNNNFINDENIPDEILNKIKLPRPMINSSDLNFSFSGLKTAVLYLVKNLQKDFISNSEDDLNLEIKSKISHEFENAVSEVLISKTKKAIQITDAKTLILGGGVISNVFLRKEFKNNFDDKLELLFPTTDLSTDNATMIAIAGFVKSFREKPEINEEIIANGSLSI